MGKNIFVGILLVILAIVGYNNVYLTLKKKAPPKTINKPPPPSTSTSTSIAPEPKKVKKKPKIKVRPPLRGEIQRSPFITFDELDVIRAQEINTLRKAQKQIARKIIKKKKKKLSLSQSTLKDKGGVTHFPNLTLTSILVNPDGSNIAVINGNVVSEGNFINNVEISRISNKTVTLKIGSSTKEVSLRESEIPLKVQ